MVEKDPDQHSDLLRAEPVDGKQPDERPALEDMEHLALFLQRTVPPVPALASYESQPPTLKLKLSELPTPKPGPAHAQATESASAPATELQMAPGFASALAAVVAPEASAVEIFPEGHPHRPFWQARAELVQLLKEGAELERPSKTLGQIEAEVVARLRASEWNPNEYDPAAYPGKALVVDPYADALRLEPLFRIFVCIEPLKNDLALDWTARPLMALFFRIWNQWLGRPVDALPNLEEMETQRAGQSEVGVVEQDKLQDREYVLKISRFRELMRGERSGSVFLDLSKVLDRFSFKRIFACVPSLPLEPLAYPALGHIRDFFVEALNVEQARIDPSRRRKFGGGPNWSFLYSLNFSRLKQPDTACIDEDSRFGSAMGVLRPEALGGPYTIQTEQGPHTFMVEAPLGAGAVARVFKGRDQIDRRPVAIRSFIQPRFYDDMNKKALLPDMDALFPDEVSFSTFLGQVEEIMRELFPPKGELPSCYFSFRNISDDFWSKLEAAVRSRLPQFLGDSVRDNLRQKFGFVVVQMHHLSEGFVKERIRAELKKISGADSTMIPATYAKDLSHGVLVEEFCEGKNLFHTFLHPPEVFAQFEETDLKNLFAQIGHLYRAVRQAGFQIPDFCLGEDIRITLPPNMTIRALDWNLVRSAEGGKAEETRLCFSEMGHLLFGVSRFMLAVMYAAPDDELREKIMGWLTGLEQLTGFSRKTPFDQIKNVDESRFTLEQVIDYLVHLP